MRCGAIYTGPGAAKGGRCLLVNKHDGEHSTVGIAMATSDRMKLGGVIQDGSMPWRFSDAVAMIVETDLPDKEKLYEYLGRRFANWEHTLTIEQRTDLDGIIWALADDLSQESTCDKLRAGV